MQEKDRLTRALVLAIVLAAFSLPTAGRTQITITEEYKGEIREQKPHGLFHASGEVKLEGGLSPSHVSELKAIIQTTDLPVLRDALENTILLDLYEKGSYATLLNEANAYLEKYPQGDPVFRPHILFHVAEALYYQGAYQDAMLRYRELMTDYSASEIYTFAHQGLAWCLMHLGRREEARENFKRLSPTTVEGYIAAWFGQAINEFNDKKYQEAVRLFFDETKYQQIPLEGTWGPLAKSLVPKNLYYRGLAYDRLGDQQAAIQDFRRVAEDYPDHPKAGPATYLVGRLSFNLEDYDQAIKYFKRALNLVTDSSDVREIKINLSQAYYNAGRLTEAVDNWKEIKRVWGPAVANTGLEQCYTRLVGEALGGDYGILPTDSLEHLLNDFAADLPTSKDLPTFQYQLAERFDEDGNYRKVLEWTALAMAGQASEEVIRDAKELRLYSLYNLKHWEKLIEEGDKFYAQYPRAIDTGLLFALGEGHARVADALKNTDPTVANDHYQKAVPFLERFLREVSAEHPYYTQAQELLNYCKSQSQ